MKPLMIVPVDSWDLYIGEDGDCPLRPDEVAGIQDAEALEECIGEGGIILVTGTARPDPPDGDGNERQFPSSYLTCDRIELFCGTRPGDSGFPEVLARARVLSAAPDLLKAAKAALEFLVRYDKDKSQGTREDLHRAIARAEGRPS